MLRFILPLALAATTATAEPAAKVEAAITDLILPGYATFAEEGAQLRAAAGATCDPTDETLRAAYHDAFDAWMSVSHLRFGPAENSGAAFILAFWPDTRGATPKTLTRLIAEDDPALTDPDQFAEVSAAGRGFFALEYLLFDPALTAAEPETARCALVSAVAMDISRLADGLAADWGSYQTKLLDPSAGGRFQTDQEAAQALFKALSEGLQFTHEVRLGRPLGTFDRPPAYPRRGTEV
ncbi:MAG: imelysin family protein [Shimia sp.]